MTEKKPIDLKTFIKNVNKKDKINGNKPDFAWMKNKGK